jgi:hypothetical protein
VTTHQPSMYTAVGPLVDDRFSGAVRRQLDKTSWVEVVPGWMLGRSHIAEPACRIRSIRATPSLDVQQSC